MRVARIDDDVIDIGPAGGAHRQLAERFGRKVIDGLIAQQSTEYLEHYARLAGSYARMVIEQEQDARNIRHREEVARAFQTMPSAWRGF